MKAGCTAPGRHYEIRVSIDLCDEVGVFQFPEMCLPFLLENFRYRNVLPRLDNLIQINKGPTKKSGQGLPQSCLSSPRQPD